MKNLMKSVALLAVLSTPVLADDMMPKMEDVSVGQLTLSDGFAHATLPNQPVAGGFITITNTGDAADTLIAVQSDIADVMQIHEMAMQDDTMVMRELEGGVVVPAGEAVMLKPGGMHLMFMQLNGPLVEGEDVFVTATFENAGEVELTLPIRKKMMGGHGTMQQTDGDS
jgi:copper(I)-binding protein